MTQHEVRGIQAKSQSKANRVNVKNSKNFTRFTGVGRMVSLFTDYQ
jgi:hypothetical protein